MAFGAEERGSEDVANAYLGLGLKIPARERVIMGWGMAGAEAVADVGGGSDADGAGLGVSCVAWPVNPRSVVRSQRMQQHLEKVTRGWQA